jgi:hypothetical protein
VLKGSKAVTVTLTGTGSLFTIGAGQNLTLAQNITLEGVDDNTRPLIQVSASGVFVMKDNSKIIDNVCVNNSAGGGVFAYEDSAFTMKGGTISGNTATNGSGGGVNVRENSIFTMEGGTISNNIVSGDGGGVSIWHATFTMRGGSSVNNNTAAKGGGGVHTSENSIFTMEGGSSVSNNTAKGGGGVRVGENASFIMEGGVIGGNTASDGGGGGVSVWRGTFTMRSGMISGNIGGSGGGVKVNEATFIKKGGTIYGDTDNTFGNGPSTDNTATDGAHAVGAGKQRKTTAGPEVKLYASYKGGSWSYDGTSVGVGNTTSEWQ